MEEFKSLKADLREITRKSNISCKLYAISEYCTVIQHKSNYNKENALRKAMNDAYGKGFKNADIEDVFNINLYNAYYEKAINVRKELKKLGFRIHINQKNKYWTGINEDYYIDTKKLVERLKKDKRRKKITKLLEDI